MLSAFSERSPAFYALLSAHKMSNSTWEVAIPYELIGLGCVISCLPKGGNSPPPRCSKNSIANTNKLLIAFAQIGEYLLLQRLYPLRSAPERPFPDSLPAVRFLLFFRRYVRFGQL